MRVRFYSAYSEMLASGVCFLLRIMMMFISSRPLSSIRLRSNMVYVDSSLQPCCAMWLRASIIVLKFMRRPLSSVSYCLRLLFSP